MPEITFLNNTTAKETINAELNLVLQNIKNGDYSKYRDELAQIKDDKNRKDYKAYKVPGFMVSGLFEEGKKASNLVNHSGFIAMDFDDLKDQIRHAKEELYADDYTYCGFESISGNGLCIIVKIDPKKHLESFLGLEKYYYKKYGLQVDQATKNVNRIRFVSHDPNMQFNPKSKIFKEYIEKRKGRPVKIKPVVAGKNDVEYIIGQIEAQRVDLTQDYQTWLEIGMALNSEFGERGLDYFQRVSQFYSDYDPDKTEKKYRSFGKSNGGIKIATFFHYAKQAGLDIITPKSKLIATIASYAKKGRRTAHQAIDQLEKMDGIDPAESTEIVNKIFTGEAPDIIKDDEDLVFQIEEFIRREYKIRYNEVTNKYEINGIPMTDRDTNTVFLTVKKVIPKASKDLVISCIDSDLTPVYNPIKEFFSQNSKINETGLIRTLADTITTPTGKVGDSPYPDFAYYFIRKWMIGAVAMWHKHHSPLMLVLAGEIQNTGKTHWFRYLLPDKLQPYFGEAELTGDKDENLLMCSKMILLNDEMSNKSRKDITMVKKLCSAQWFNIRKPYGRLAEDIRRIAALAGTSNPTEILSDPTGNRRIIPIEVLAINHEKYNNIDKVALWIEAYHAFKSGEEFQLTKHDIEILGSQTQNFEESSPEADLIMKFFYPADTNRSTKEMTATEIKDHIESRSQQRLSIRKVGMELKRLGYKKRGLRVNGVMKQIYDVSEILNPHNVSSNINNDVAPF